MDLNGTPGSDFQIEGGGFSCPLLLQTEHWALCLLADSGLQWKMWHKIFLCHCQTSCCSHAVHGQMSSCSNAFKRKLLQWPTQNSWGLVDCEGFGRPVSCSNEQKLYILGKVLDTALCAVTAVIPGYAQGMQFETGNGQLSLVMGSFRWWWGG